MKHSEFMGIAAANWGKLKDRSKYEAMEAEDRKRFEKQNLRESGKWNLCSILNTKALMPHSHDFYLRIVKIMEPAPGIPSRL